MYIFALSHVSIKSGDCLICMSFNHRMTEVCFADVPGLHRLAVPRPIGKSVGLSGILRAVRGSATTCMILLESSI